MSSLPCLPQGISTCCSTCFRVFLPRSPFPYRFWGDLASFCQTALVFDSWMPLHAMPTSFFGCFYLVLQYKFTGWWFGTFFIFPYIGNFIIPTEPDLDMLFSTNRGAPLSTTLKTSLHFTKDCCSICQRKIMNPGWFAGIPKKRNAHFNHFHHILLKWDPPYLRRSWARTTKLKKKVVACHVWGNLGWAMFFSPFATGGDHRLYTNYSSLKESRVSKIGHHFRM